MQHPVFIDSSVLIRAIENNESNSYKIVELVTEKKIEAVISEKVLKEVIQYTKREHRKDAASKYNVFLTSSCEIVLSEEILDELPKWRGKIKESDLEHLATVKKLGIKILIAFDRDYKPFSEYMTPKEFLKKIGIKTSNIDY